VKQNNSDGIAAIGFGLGDKIELTKTINLFKLFFVLTKADGRKTENLRFKNVNDLRCLAKTTPCALARFRDLCFLAINIVLSVIVIIPLISIEIYKSI
jgi:hypothetical protein